MKSSKIIAKCLVAAAIFGFAPATLFADNPTGTSATGTSTGNMPQGSMMKQSGGDDHGEIMRLREENRRLKEENERLKRQVEEMRNRKEKQGVSSQSGKGN